jgi:hypothetical protein
LIVRSQWQTAIARPRTACDLEHYRVVARLEGHVGRVFSARWVVGGQILTAGDDGTARLWDGATGKLRHVYREGSRILADATLTPDGLVYGAQNACKDRHGTQELRLRSLREEPGDELGMVELVEGGRETRLPRGRALGPERRADLDVIVGARCER